MAKGKKPKTSEEEIKDIPTSDVVDVNGEQVELMEVTVTQETLDASPEMVEEGVKVGDTIQVAKTDEGDALLTKHAEAGDDCMDDMDLSEIDVTVEVAEDENPDATDDADEPLKEIDYTIPQATGDLTPDELRWERYLKTIGLSLEKFLETRPNHPKRHIVQAIHSKRNSK